MMGERKGGSDPCDPPGKRSFVRRSWDWFTGLFKGGVDHGYKSNARLKVNNNLQIGIPTKMSEEEFGNTSWDAGDTHYQQVSQNTLLTSKIGGWHERGKYEFILPQNIGGWSQDNTASDGLIYKGCLSCHADNGAFTYAVKNSSTAGIGKSVGLLATFYLQTKLYTPEISGMSADTEEFVNMASAARTKHIIAGDATGGGHAWFGSFKSFFNGIKGVKSMFPATWSNEKIMHAVSEVAINNAWVQQTGRAGATLTRSGYPVRFVVEGFYEGVRIRVITTHTEIITAFPIR